MIDINKVKEDRYKFLYKVYEISNGQMAYMVNGDQVGKELGFDSNYSANIYYYLNEEGLTEPMGAGIRLAITHLGIKEIEESLENPAKPTEHFLPIQQYNINIGTMSGGAIQQASENSTINYSFSDKTKEDISSLLDELKEVVSILELKEEEREELEVDIQTIEVQNRSNKPKKVVIKTLLNSVKAILERASGSILADVASPSFSKLTQKLGQILSNLN